jgi:hypothetical protein
MFGHQAILEANLQVVLEYVEKAVGLEDRVPVSGFLLRVEDSLADLAAPLKLLLQTHIPCS